MNFSSSLIGGKGHHPKGGVVDFPHQRIADVYRQIETEAASPLRFAGVPFDQATIGVVDVFATAPEEEPRHGDEVNAVILNNGFQESDTLKIRADVEPLSAAALNSLLYKEGPEPFGQRLDAYIELAAGQTLAKTNGIFRQLADKPDLQLKTLNQSQGESRMGVYWLLLGAAWNGRKDGRPLITETGRKMAQACGFDPDEPDFNGWNLNQSLIDRVNSVIDASELIAGLQKEHGDLIERLKQRGVSVVASAGNNNDEFMDTRQTYGHTIPETFDDDITSVGDKLVVGALDDKGTPDPSDDDIAFFSSRYGQVSVLAQGINVPTLPGRTGTGTSYAAPIVAARLETLRREQPELSPDQLQEATRGLFRRTDGYNILPPTGSGV